jgi:DNA-binding response OmpR family regulator
VKRRVVIFDDDELIRKALWLFFDRRQYEIFTFPYPDACPLHVTSACPCPLGTSCSDLIVSDVNMGGRNGIDFIEELMKKGCRQRHFAVMSGAFTEADRARAARLGCTVIEKPLFIDALTAWVEAVEKTIPSKRLLFDWVGVA